MRQDFIDLENRVAKRMHSNKGLRWREAMAEIIQTSADKESERLKRSYTVLQPWSSCRFCQRAERSRLQS